MSLANLSNAYGLMQFRLQMADDQVKDVLDLLVKHFLDGDPAAWEWLKQLAEMHREKPQ